jgi:hypothetical protein
MWCIFKKQEARQLDRYIDGLWADWLMIDSCQMQGFSLLHSIQTSSRDHTAYYLLGIGDPFPGGKAARK